MINRPALLICIATVLGGCATDATKPSQDDLQPAAVSNQIVLKKRITINTFKSGSNGLVSGTYIPVAENSDGIFYDGPKDCVWEIVDQQRTTYDGGLWWPKQEGRKPRMYWRLSDKQVPSLSPEMILQIGVVGYAFSYWLVSSGFGNVNFFPEISNQNILESISPVTSAESK